MLSDTVGSFTEIIAQIAVACFGDWGVFAFEVTGIVPPPGKVGKTGNHEAYGLLCKTILEAYPELKNECVQQITMKGL